MTDHAPIRHFAIGDVIGRGFRLYFSNLTTFVPLSLIAFLPVWLGLLLVEQGAAMGPGGAGASVFIMVALQTVAGYWLQAALVYGTISSMRGHPASFGETFAKALAALGSVILLGIVISFLVGLGMILFIVPGIIVMVMFFVAIPAAVVERNGVGAAMTRSRELTKGHRWSIFALFVVMMLALTLVSGLVGFATGVGKGQIGDAGLWINQIVSMFIAGIWATITAVAYHDLRILKDGGDTETIARAFD